MCTDKRSTRAARSPWDPFDLGVLALTACVVLAPWIIAALTLPAGPATAHPGGYDEHDCHHQWGTDAEGRRYAVEYHCRPGTQYAEHGPWADRGAFEAWLAAGEPATEPPAPMDPAEAWMDAWRAWLAEHPGPVVDGQYDWADDRWDADGYRVSCTGLVRYGEGALHRYEVRHVVDLDPARPPRRLPTCGWED